MHGQGQHREMASDPDRPGRCTSSEIIHRTTSDGVLVGCAAGRELRSTNPAKPPRGSGEPISLLSAGFRQSTDTCHEPEADLVRLMVLTSTVRLYGPSHYDQATRPRGATITSRRPAVPRRHHYRRPSQARRECHNVQW